MRKKSFTKKYGNKVYGQLWSELETAICSGCWKENLFASDMQTQEYTVQEIQKTIKKELPDIVSEYLHVLALSNHSRPAFDSIRYCGDDAKKLSELYLQKQLVYEQVDSFGYPLVTPDELADTEWMTEFLFARKIRTFFSDGIGDNIESPMYYQFIQTEEDNEKTYEKHADELLDALIEDAILLYLSKHQEPIKAKELYAVQVAKAMQSSKLKKLIAKISQGTPQRKKLVANRRINTITCSIIEILLSDRQNRNQEELFIGTTPEILIIGVLYLIHTSSPFGISFPNDIWQQLVECLKHTPDVTNILKFIKQAYIDFEESAYAGSKYETWKKYNRFFSQFVSNIQIKSFLPTFSSQPAAVETCPEQNDEIKTLKLTFLNYFIASPAQWKQALSHLSPGYTKKQLPSSYDDIDAILHVSSPMNEDGTFEIPRFSHTLTARDTLIFPTEDLFWTFQSSSGLFLTIKAEDSNYSLLLHTFWEMQKLLGMGYSLNKSITLEYLNRLTGAADIALFTGTQKRAPRKKTQEWKPLCGMIYGGGKISFHALSPQKTQSSKYPGNPLICGAKHSYESNIPYELYVRGLKTKYVLNSVYTSDMV